MPNVTPNIRQYTEWEKFTFPNCFSSANFAGPETPVARCQADPLTSDFIDEQHAIYGSRFRSVVCALSPARTVLGSQTGLFHYPNKRCLRASVHTIIRNLSVNVAERTVGSIFSLSISGKSIVHGEYRAYFAQARTASYYWDCLHAFTFTIFAGKQKVQTKYEEYRPIKCKLWYVIKRWTLTTDVKILLSSCHTQFTQTSAYRLRL